MQDLYSSIHNKSVPIVQPNLLQSDSTYCKAIWAMGKWSFTNEYHIIMSLLRERLGCKAIFYTVDAPTNSSDGVLHWTLFQTNTFPVSTEHGANPTLAEEGECLRKLTYSYPHLEITFRGFSMTRYGLFLCGYPSWDVNRIRADIRTEFSQRGFTIHEPHPQDIAHATLLRLIQPLSDEEHVWLRELADRYWNTELVRFLPTRWEFGFGTWLQRESERIVCTQWPAHPRWILHRGLSNGVDHDIENREEHLWKQLNDGWDIECDVWRDGSGTWWLGHDNPQYPIQNSVALLTHPRAWIHCKNLEALCACAHGSGRTYFSHDVDNAVLTSTGHIWAYPGNIIHGQMSVCVMPERHGFSLRDMEHVGAICSDFLPLHFQDSV